MNGGNDSVGRGGEREKGGWRSQAGSGEKKKKSKGQRAFRSRIDCTHQGRRRAPLAAGLAWSDPCMLELSGGGGADADGRYARSDAPLQEVPDPITNAGQYSHTRYCAGMRPVQSRPWFTW